MKKLTEMSKHDLVFIRHNGKDHGVETVEYAMEFVSNNTNVEVYTVVETKNGPIDEKNVKDFILDQDSIYMSMHPDDDVIIDEEALLRITELINKELVESNIFYAKGELVDVDPVYIQKAVYSDKKREIIRTFNRVISANEESLTEEQMDKVITVLKQIDGENHESGIC